MRIRVGDRVFVKRGRKVYRVMSIRQEYGYTCVGLRSVTTGRLMHRWTHHFNNFRVQLIARPLLLPVGA